MKELRLEYPLVRMAPIFDVSISGYYAWHGRKPSKRTQEEPRLVLEVNASQKRMRETYGPERLQSDLADHGVQIGAYRIERIRKDHGIRCKQKRAYKQQRTQNSRHTHPVAENLLNLRCPVNSGRQ